MIGVWTAAGRVASWRRRATIIGGVSWAFIALAVLVGLVMDRFFDALVAGSSDVYLWAGALLGVELGRRVLIHPGAMVWNHAWVAMETVLRINMLRGQVASGGGEAAIPVTDPGSAISRFRDDPEDVAWFVDNWVDLSGATLLTLSSLVLLFRVEPVLALAVVLPLVVVGIGSQLLSPYVERVRKADLDAASGVTGVLRDVFAARDVVVANGAVGGVVDAVADRCDDRRKTAVRNRVLTEVIRTGAEGAGHVAVALCLFAIAGPIRNGSVGIGDLALVTSLIGFITGFPRMLAYTLARRSHSEVAFTRMSALVAGGRREALVSHPDFAFDERVFTPAPVRGLRSVPALQLLAVRDLAVEFDGVPVLQDVSFDIEPGTLTVVTGPVGAGKTTLLRALIGLVPATGDVRWNDEVVDDPGAFFVPPRIGYLPQVPRLFSETLSANIALGRAVDDDHLAALLGLVGLDEEIAALPAGIDAEIGSRGIRLSGGQRQRVAAARAMAPSPALLVIDDVSSALDIETELALWERLRARGTTVLASSTRPIALDLADRVITLADGSVVEARR